MSVVGWHQNRIGDFFASSRPGEWGREGNPETGVPVLRSTNFCDDGSIDYTDMAYRIIPDGRLGSRRVGLGSILVEKAGGSSTRPAGRVVYCNRDFAGTASNFVEVIQVSGDFDAKFVFYLLYHYFNAGLVYKYQQQTTGIINFKLKEYCSELAAAPTSKLEQVKIAEVLSTVDQAIEQTEALIDKQRRIKTGLMQDLLTRGINEHGDLRSEATHKFKDSPLGRIPAEWRIKPVAETGSVDLGRQLSPKYMKGKTPTPYLRVANVFDGWINYGDILAMDFTDVEKAKYMLRPGDVLLNEGQSRELVGRSAIYRGPTNTYCFQNTLVRYRPHADMRPEFAHAIFKRWLDTGIFADVARQTTSVAHLGADRFAKMLMPAPEEQEQDRIISVLAPADHTIARYEESSRKLRLIKTGLMQDLLTGDRRVTALMEEGVTT
jgi:type I restriction enzyme S subunit